MPGTGEFPSEVIDRFPFALRKLGEFWGETSLSPSTFLISVAICSPLPSRARARNNMPPFRLHLNTPCAGPWQAVIYSLLSLVGVSLMREPKLYPA